MAGPLTEKSGGVYINGLSAFRRDLRKLDKGLDLEVSRYIREKAKEVRDTARERTPVGRTDRRSSRQRRPGTLRKSIKHSVRQKSATLYSNQPDSGVHEWGGTIRPRGKPIRIRGKAMLRGAVAQHTDDVEEHMARMFDRLAGP